MKTISMILKGLLFWFSTIIIVLIITGIDSIAENYGLIAIGISILICFGLVTACVCLMTTDEALTVSGAKLLDKLFGNQPMTEFKDDDDENNTPSVGCTC